MRDREDFDENYKTLLRNTREDLNQWKDTAYLYIRRLSIKTSVP